MGQSGPRTQSHQHGWGTRAAGPPVWSRRQGGCSEHLGREEHCSFGSRTRDQTGQERHLQGSHHNITIAVGCVFFFNHLFIPFCPLQGLG